MRAVCCVCLLSFHAGSLRNIVDVSTASQVEAARPYLRPCTTHRSPRFVLAYVWPLVRRQEATSSVHAASPRISFCMYLALEDGR